MCDEGRKATGISGLDAVVLIANDFNGQCRFYRDLLGLEMISHYGDAAFFRAGDQVVGIFARNHHPEGTRNLGGASHGISHLEFRLNKDEISNFIAKLKGAGSHAYGECFVDADGNLFHFNTSDRKR
jgi:catechol 2,3-dioxygenase-like lactoylglutathione lyase family enzyme